MLGRALQAGELPRKPWWRTLLLPAAAQHCRRGQNRVQDPSRPQRKRTRSRKKRTQSFSQKRIPHLKPEAGKADQQAKLVPAEALRRNLAGTAICCMIVFTPPGSNR